MWLTSSLQLPSNAGDSGTALSLRDSIGHERCCICHASRNPCVLGARPLAH
jgi:hypothetical protein